MCSVSLLIENKVEYQWDLREFSYVSVNHIKNVIDLNVRMHSETFNNRMGE